jgi:hypothetical protein
MQPLLSKCANKWYEGLRKSVPKGFCFRGVGWFFLGPGAGPLVGAVLGGLSLTNYLK